MPEDTGAADLAVGSWVCKCGVTKCYNAKGWPLLMVCHYCGDSAEVLGAQA